MSSWRLPKAVLATFAEKGWLSPKEVAHIYEAFFGVEPYVDSFQRIFFGQAFSEGKPPRTMLVGVFTLVDAWVVQFIKFDETSSSHGGHTSADSVPV